jgi:hypothetical protein
MSEGQQEYTDPQRRGHHEHHVRTPTDELSHTDKLERQRTHIWILTGALVVLLVGVVYSAAFDLDSAAEWIVLGAIVFTAAGMTIAVHTR